MAVSGQGWQVGCFVDDIVGRGVVCVPYIRFGMLGAYSPDIFILVGNNHQDAAVGRGFYGLFGLLDRALLTVSGSIRHLPVFACAKFPYNRPSF